MVNTDSSPLSHHRPDLPVGNPLSVISTTINPPSRMILESHLFLPTPPHIPHTINYQAQPIPPLKYLFNPSSLQSLQTSPWSDSFCNSLMGLYVSKLAIKLHVSDRWIFSISNLIVPLLFSLILQYLLFNITSFVKKPCITLEASYSIGGNIN